MPFKLNKNHRDYLYWLWPIIFMGLAFVAVKLDKHNNSSPTHQDTSVNVDSSRAISAQTIIPDSNFHY